MLNSHDDGERRLARVEARAAIENLIAGYCMACDDRDIVRLASLFTEDAFFGAKDRSNGAQGRRAIFDYYRGRFEVMGPSYHWTHDRLIEFDAARSDWARGTIQAHCEMSSNGAASVGALRYHDEYVCEQGTWRFAVRGYEFLYLAPADGYAQALTADKRVLFYGKWKAAELPETRPTWQSWRSAKYPG